MNRSRWTLALAFGTVAMGVILGALAFLDAPRVSAQPGKAPPAALDWIPDTAGLVGHIDVKSIASSPLSEVWSREAKREGDLGPVDEIRKATGIDLWNDVQSLTFSAAVPRASSPPHPSRATGQRQPWGMVISGSFDAERLVQQASEHQGAANKENYRGVALYRLEGEGDKELAFALASDSLLLLGSPDYLREMIDCGQGRKPSASGLVKSWGYGDFAGDAFWIAGQPTAAVDSVLGRVSAGPSLRSFALSGRLDTDLSVTARGKAADAESARKLADVLRGFVALGRLHQAENPQITGIIDGLQIDLVGDEIHVGLNLPYETIRSFIDQQRKAAMDR